ncbi:methyl-accepting chemotaxis protein [Paenibacillus sp. CF384]|uniref:methyl-accepting chemotaxis protein n=1 Tax=Paenibacillus sp. CF384 TaxID=1884382 RepID=UPI0008967C90|nr:methyl-accepting chemotaxis protein [Paenibacillus sp. CF384]SDW42913.1 methyl-accepting chemotaxis protein [Paenibacillus sp. CF384]
MLREKNRVMLFISTIIVLLSLLVHAFDWLGFSMHHDHQTDMNGSTFHTFLKQTFFALPIMFVLLAGICMRLQKEQQSVPLLLTLSLTFSSISIIAGGNGMVEYHFSIFMVLAIILYYDLIAMLLISTVIFALQHVLGFLLFPALVYGTRDYSLAMVSIHIVFVVLFIGAVTYQIVTRRAFIHALESAQQQKIQAAVKQIIENVTETSDQVLMNSKELSCNAATLNLLAGDIVQTMHQVDATAHLQEHGAQTGKKVIGEMLREIHTIAETSATVSTFSSEVATEADNGNEAIQKAVRQMTSMSNAVQESATKVKLLGQRSQEIDDITSLITDIASQTSLLALNAAIEAARAGEHGRGFTVVSNEVRKLSEQTTASAQRIAELVQDIQSNNRASIQSMDQVISEVASGNQAVCDAGAAFERIMRSIRTVAEQIHYISGASQQMSASTQLFSVNIEEISRMSVELTGSVKTVTGSSNEQHQLISRSSELATMLEKLSDKLDQTMVNTRKSFHAI